MHSQPRKREENMIPEAGTRAGMDCGQVGALFLGGVLIDGWMMDGMGGEPLSAASVA